MHQIPRDRLLLETDSPYLAPEPHREETNEPARIPLILAAVAAGAGEPTEEAARLTWHNALRAFKLEGRVSSPSTPRAAAPGSGDPTGAEA